MIIEISDTRVDVRPAVPADRTAIDQILKYEELTHKHMDWKLPVDWLGDDPYLIAEKLGRPAALIACPPDPAEVAWIRAFAVNNLLTKERAWDLLWDGALRKLSRTPGVERVLTIAMEDWFRELLNRSGFKQRVMIQLLSWENSLKPLPTPSVSGTVRQMEISDLPAVAELDRAAFYPLWHHSLQTLELAHSQAVVATVSESAGDTRRITGYSMSTSSPFGGHLARLAVRPEDQGQGIGYALLFDTLTRFRQRGALRVTVNTQADNSASLRLYQKASFHPTGESYPVYEYPVNPAP